MRKIVQCFFCIAVFAIGITSCTESEVVEELNLETENLKSHHIGEWDYNSSNDFYYSTNPGEIETCEEADNYPFFNTAQISISNSEDFFYVKVTAIDNANLIYLRMNIFNDDETPPSPYWEFKYNRYYTLESNITCIIFKIPKQEDWTDCIKFSIKIKSYHPEDGYVNGWGTNNNEYNGNYYQDYCWKECNPCPPQKIGDIVAAQHHNVGDLVVWEDDEYLYINYDLEEGYNLDEAHVYVGCIDKMPATKKGNPKNGHFPYHIGDFNDNVLMIALADLENICKDANGCWPIAAHGVVSKKMGNKVWSETSWSTGTKFDAQRWGWYSTYCPCE